jgi:adenylylsulfate kinase
LLSRCSRAPGARADTEYCLDENILLLEFTAELLTRNGIIVQVAAILRYRAVRDETRARINDFVDIYLHVPLAIAESRDLNGIYGCCQAGEIHRRKGLDEPYKPPLTPDVECHAGRESPAESVEEVIAVVEERLASRK